MTNMKDIIRIFYRNNWDSAEMLAQNELIKEAAIETAVEYAGLDMDGVIVDRVELTGSGEDRLCRVDFRYIRFEPDEYRRCGMSWCSYVDVTTGEVVGFAGSTELASADMEEPA